MGSKVVRYRDDNDNNTVEGYLDKSVHNLSVTYETHDDFTSERKTVYCWFTKIQE